jgi:hypothetical protein
MNQQDNEAYLRERYGGLLAGEDIPLFTDGGCHIFAAALHRRFKYPIILVPGIKPNAVIHIFCRFEGNPSFCVDVLGFTLENILIKKRDWEKVVRIFPADIDTYKTFGRGSGVFAQEWFTIPAEDRAEKRINAYLEYYNGQKKQRVPDSEELK